MIKSEKQKDQLLYNGYAYRKYQENNEKDLIYWRCVQKTCRSSIKTNISVSEIKISPSEHSHNPNPNEISARKI